MTRVPHLLLSVASVAFVACECVGSSSSNASESPDLRVQLVDRVTGVDVCNATVAVGSTSSQQQLFNNPTGSGECRYLGYLDPGVYTVTANAAGYESVQRKVIVSGGECGGTVTSDVTLDLTLK